MFRSSNSNKYMVSYYYSQEHEKFLVLSACRFNFFFRFQNIVMSRSIAQRSYILSLHTETDIKTEKYYVFYDDKPHLSCQSNKQTSEE